MSDRKRIGVLGGTFDPIHTGHLEIARAAECALCLDLVLLVPAGCQYLRGGAGASVEDRVAMAERAVVGEESVEISLVDANRGGPTYTVDTLRELREELGEDVAFYFLMGGDTLADLPRWRSPESLHELCRLVSVGRPGQPRPEDLPETHPGHGAIYIEGPMLEVSGTEIRRRIAEGESAAGLVPEPVMRYIRQRGLYRTADEAEGKDRAWGD